MVNKFAQKISVKDNAYYPLQFLASDFFVPYWNCFIPPIPDKFIPEIQKAARACVDYFMDNEEIYWLVSFEEKHALKTWELFEKQISGLSKDIIELVHHLSFQIAVPEEESDSADYFIGLVTRLRFDGSYRRELNYRNEDKNILDAIYEYSADKFIDLDGIKNNWLDSGSFWDNKLKSQTPDLLESVYVIFSFAYNPNSCLILLHNNLHLILDTEETYHAFIDRLEAAFVASLPSGTKIEFPRLMKI